MFCKYCGKEVNIGSKYCKHCGSLLINTTSISLGTETKTEKCKPFLKTLKYSFFMCRFSAFVIDLSLILILLFIVVIIFPNQGDSFDNAITLIILFGYHILFLSLYSATPGKMLFGLKVVDDNTRQNIIFIKAVIRTFSYIISTFLIGLGFLKILFDRSRNKALHDDIAKTIVVQTKYRKKIAIPITILSILLFVFILFIYSDDESEEPYTIREGTRQIQNQIKLNEELFKESKEITNETNKVNTINQEAKFDVNKELAAVVAVTCPDNNGNYNRKGSGIIITDSGIVLTNYHVIEDADTYYCQIGVTNDLSKRPEYIYYANKTFSDSTGSYELINKELDVALLQIENASEGYKLPSKFPKITKIGSSDKLNINDKIFLAGYPSFGSGTITFTDGVVSGRTGDDLIKTSAKIDFGNSGGAAFNKNGEFVGIPTLLYKGGTEGMGYILGTDSIMEWIGDNIK